MRTATTFFLGFGLLSTTIGCAPTTPATFDADGWTNGTDPDDDDSDSDDDDGSGSSSGSDDTGGDDDDDDGSDSYGNARITHYAYSVEGSMWGHASVEGSYDGFMEADNWIPWQADGYDDNTDMVTVNMTAPVSRSDIECDGSDCDYPVLVTNVTLCERELDEDEEPSGSYAESIGCTWGAYGSVEGGDVFQNSIPVVEIHGYTFGDPEIVTRDGASAFVFKLAADLAD